MGRRRHTSFVGPILLIVIGAALLVGRLYPGFDLWPALFRYWPLILIFIGFGKIWDSYYARGHAGQMSGPWMSGTGIACIVIAVAVFAVARRADVRLVLPLAGLTLGVLGGDAAGVVQTFLATLSKELARK